MIKYIYLELWGTQPEEIFTKKTLDEALRMCNAVYAITVEDAASKRPLRSIKRNKRGYKIYGKNA